MNYRDLQKSGSDAPLIKMKELKDWILEENSDLLVINKPGWLVCHPSKNGPMSSLVGACREYTQLDTLHLVSRLDRETSGLVILAKNRPTASKLQKALQERQVHKDYLAILEGELKEPILVNKSLAKDLDSPVYVKQTVRKSNSAQRAKTEFIPLYIGNHYTLARVHPITGRKHQIRAHAEYLEHRIVGDKVYGPDATLYLEFIEQGWTDRLESTLPLWRQGLHAGRLTFKSPDFEGTFFAPMLEDMKQFCIEKIGIDPTELEKLQSLPPVDRSPSTEE